MEAMDHVGDDASVDELSAALVEGAEVLPPAVHSGGTLGREVDAVRIEDEERQLTYEITTAVGDDGPYVTSLTLLPFGDQPVTQAMLDRIPLRELARTARAELAEPTHDADGNRLLRVTKRKGRWQRPSPEQVAEWHKQARYDGESPRAYIADLTGIPVGTVDRLIREARDAGLIKPTEIGRPRKGQQA